MSARGDRMDLIAGPTGVAVALTALDVAWRPFAALDGLRFMGLIALILMLFREWVAVPEEAVR